jgi:polyisoprenoid-binding protein YceI
VAIQILSLFLDIGDLSHYLLPIAALLIDRKSPTDLEAYMITVYAAPGIIYAPLMATDPGTNTVVPQAGTHKLGPDNGTLSVKTERTGAAAKAGHNLLIHVTSWEATLAIGEDPGDTSLSLDVDATSLRVIEGTGGIQSLGDDDKENIKTSIDDDVLKRKDIEFRSTEVQPSGDGKLTVTGDLTLAGKSNPITFDLHIGEDGKLAGSAVVKQTNWKMKPYSALFGTLKVVDEVTVEIDGSLPSS